MFNSALLLGKMGTDNYVMIEMIKTIERFIKEDKLNDVLSILKDAFVKHSHRNFHRLYFILRHFLGLEEEVLAPIQIIIVICQ